LKLSSPYEFASNTAKLVCTILRWLSQCLLTTHEACTSRDAQLTLRVFSKRGHSLNCQRAVSHSRDLSSAGKGPAFDFRKICLTVVRVETQIPVEPVDSRGEIPAVNGRPPGIRKNFREAEICFARALGLSQAALSEQPRYHSGEQVCKPWERIAYGRVGSLGKLKAGDHGSAQ
jgi:hypothetical protein